MEGRVDFLLVDLGDEIDFVEIDKNYDGILYLNGDFKVTDYDDDYQFIMFVNIEPGNTLVRYRLACLGGKQRIKCYI